MTNAATRNLRLLNILVFLSGFRLFDPVLPLLIAGVTGSYGLAMTGLALMHVSASVFEIPTGVFSDWIGRRWTMIVYHTSYAGAVFILWLADSTFLIFLALVIAGFGMAMRTGASTAYVYENLEVLGRVGDFKKQEGLRQATGRWALVLSGLLGTVVIYFFDIHATVLATAVVLAAAGVLSFWLKDVRVYHAEESNVYAHLGDAWRQFKSDPILRNITLGKVIAVGAGNSEWRYRALLFSSIMPEWLVSLLNTFNHVATAVANQSAHRVVHKIGYRGSLVFAELFDRAATVALTLVSTVWSFFAMGAITSAVFGVREVASEDLLQERYSKKDRATMGSIVGLGGSLIYATLSILIGFLADAIGLVYTMIVLQFIMATAAYFFYRGLTSRAD